MVLAATWSAGEPAAGRVGGGPPAATTSGGQNGPVPPTATATGRATRASSSISFGSRGVQVTNLGAGGPARWTLSPSALGRGRPVALRGGTATARGATRTYDNGLISVWYARTTKGVEQGFTLARRPAGSRRAVHVVMATSGDLRPALTGPTSLAFLGADGRTDLTYSGLKVTDSTGKVLPSHFESSGSRIQIAYDDRDASYPVVVDPWLQVADLTPLATASSFGTTLAASGDGRTVLVGDPDVGVTGAATVYTFDGSTWSAGTALTPPAASAYFGIAVALSANGTTALVGDPYASATGGAAVYTLSAGAWSQAAALAPPDTAVDFGTSVALSADGATALVATPRPTTSRPDPAAPRSTT